jgi:hypothetical protein
MSDAQVPAGWFPDPEDPANLRYWDGAAWTDHRHPADPAGAPVAPAVVAAPTAAATPQFAYTPTAGAAPGYAAPYGAAPAYGAPPQNVLALVGLILAIVGAVLGLVVGIFVLVGIAGAVISILGFVQANKMRAAGTPNDRRGLALAGIIVGFGGLLLSIVIAIGTAVYYASVYSYF